MTLIDDLEENTMYLYYWMLSVCIFIVGMGYSCFWLFKLLCKDYTCRLHLHYSIWPMPVLIANIILFGLWNTSFTNAETRLAFLAVGPLLLSVLLRDKGFLCIVRWLVKKTYFKYDRYDCIGGLPYLHCGLGITVLAWNVIYSFGTFVTEGYEINSRTATALCLPFLLMITGTSVLPFISSHFDVSFKSIHAYLNWLALCLLIAHVVLVNIDQSLNWA
eukprot:163448_1